MNGVGLAAVALDEANLGQPGRRRLSPVIGSLTALGCLTGDTLPVMAEVTIRELRNHGGEVVDRVARGERVTITRSGKPVAELRPLGPAPVPAAILVERWRTLPVVDPGVLRANVDAVLDATL